MITSPSTRFTNALKASHERKLRLTLQVWTQAGVLNTVGPLFVESGTLSLEADSASWRRLSADLTVPVQTAAGLTDTATYNGELKVEMGIGFSGVDNLFTANQASAETNLAGINSYGTLARVVGTSAHGAAFLRLTTTAAHGYLDLPDVTAGQPYFRVTPGESVTVAGSVRFPSGKPSGAQYWAPYIVWWSSTGAYVTEQTLGTIRTDYPTSWTAAVESATVPSNAFYATPRFHYQGTSAGSVIEWDALGFWKGAGGTWAMPGTAVEWVQVAQLRVEEWERASDKATRSFLAYDRVQRVADFPFVTPYTTRDMAGTQLSVIDGIKDIITTAFPSAAPPVFVVDAALDATAMPPPETSFTGARWDAVLTLAQSIGAVVYNDNLGRFIIKPSLIANTPVESITGGAGGTMVSQDYSHTRVNQFNAVGMTCESPSGDGIFAYVVDNDINSPTYYDGPFGRKPFMTRNDTITEVDAAIAAARAILTRKKSGAGDMDVSTVYNPLLQPRDVVNIRRTDTSAYEAQVIDTIDLSLTKATMTIKSHIWTAEPAVLRATVGGRSVLDGP